MVLSNIYFIPTLPGLYRVVGSHHGGIIVESIADGRRLPVDGNKSIGRLNDTGIYIKDGILPLAEIFIKMKTAEQPVPSHKADNKTLWNYMKSVVPNLDEKKVRCSDVKKYIQWFILLDSKVDLMLLASVVK